MFPQVRRNDEEGHAPEKDRPVAGIQAASGMNSKGNHTSNFDERVKGMTLREASQLLSAIMFIDLNSERYHVFSNPRAKNPIRRGIVNLTMDIHPVTDLASYDDFEHDNY